MLEDLLRGQEKSSRVLIEDSAECPGRILLLNWISHLLNRYDRVILVCTERPPAFFSNWVSSEARNRLVCLCAHTTLAPDAAGSSLMNHVASSLSKSSRESAVVIDSLTSFVLGDGGPVTCSLLHRLSLDEAVSQVVSVLHTDVIDEQSCSLIEHTCTTSVTMQKSSLPTKCLCSITHSRPTGKVFKTDEFFTLDESFHILKMGPHEGDKPAKNPSEPSADQSMASLDLPFNLSLTQREKEARDQVHLPFVKYESEASSTTPSRIHYEPDEADDFDEEDPDDDLNI